MATLKGKAVCKDSLEVIKMKFETGMFFDVLDVVFDVLYLVWLKMGVLGFIELDILMLKCVEFFTGFFECILCSFVNKSQMFLN